MPNDSNEIRKETKNATGSKLVRRCGALLGLHRNKNWIRLEGKARKAETLDFSEGAEFGSITQLHFSVSLRSRVSLRIAKIRGNATSNASDFGFDFGWLLNQRDRHVADSEVTVQMKKNRTASTVRVTRKIETGVRIKKRQRET
jgi:hypothetical protein